MLCRKHLKIVMLNEVKHLALALEQFILLPVPDYSPACGWLRMTFGEVFLQSLLPAGITP